MLSCEPGLSWRYDIDYMMMSLTMLLLSFTRCTGSQSSLEKKNLIIFITYKALNGLARPYTTELVTNIAAFFLQLKI